MKLQIGDTAPRFSAPDQKGQAHSLQEFHGKWLLIYFYPKDFTPGCTIQAKDLRDNFDELNSRVTILGVSADSVDSHRHFADEYKLPYALLADPHKEMIKSYGADGLLFAKRVSFLIGPDGTIKKIYDKVDPKMHAKKILADLAELQK